VDDDTTTDPRRGFDPAQLPRFAPDAQLWQRIAGAQQRLVARRRRRTTATACAAVAVIAVAIGSALPDLRNVPSAMSSIADGQHESELLEREWQGFAVSDRTPTSAVTRLRFIDATLQAAYDRGAGTDEIVALWKQRNQALRGLITQVKAADADGIVAVTQI
jgi:hypothetical protein